MGEGGSQGGWVLRVNQNFLRPKLWPKEQSGWVSCSHREKKRGPTEIENRGCT